VRIVEKYSRISDRSVLENAYDLFAKHWRPTPLPDREGVRGILEDLARTGTKGKNRRARQFHRSDIRAQGLARGTDRETLRRQE
jgi:hypothetical protein